jgi:hypothetical protein
MTSGLIVGGVIVFVAVIGTAALVIHYLDTHGSD